MNEQNTVQELKAERVQEESLALLRKRVVGQAEAAGAALAGARSQAEQRLKAERVQTRLKRMQGWRMQKEGNVIDQVRKFSDPLVAASYLAFATLLARQSAQTLWAGVSGSKVIIALPGRSKGADKGITEEVLDLAEQLG